jgi:hypothetical protein
MGAVEISCYVWTTIKEITTQNNSVTERKNTLSQDLERV